MMIFSIRFNQLVMVVGDGINTRLIECFTPIIGTIFSNKIIWLPLHCFAFFNTNVHFCALCVWQNCGRYSEIVCGAMQGYANSMCYLVAPPVLSFGQYCYFDGFWLQIFSVQFTDCTDGAKGYYYKNRHSNTFSRSFGYLHSLDYPLTFYLCHL